MPLRLFFQAILKLTLGFFLIGVLLFLPAWTFDYPKAWLFLVILFIPICLSGLWMMRTNPDLLRRRLNAKEKAQQQNRIVQCSGLMFVMGFVLAALDFRFSWLAVPDMVSYIAAGVFLLAYGMYAEVLRENTYLSRTVEVQRDQKVIDTGLYALVRHPMYSATVLLFLSIPLVLGSLVSLAVFLVYPFLIALRIRHEEAVLEAELAGYTEYTKKVRYRLIPFVW